MFDEKKRMSFGEQVRLLAIHYCAGMTGQSLENAERSHVGGRPLFDFSSVGYLLPFPEIFT